MNWQFERCPCCLCDTLPTCSKSMPSSVTSYFILKWIYLLKKNSFIFKEKKGYVIIHFADCSDMIGFFWCLSEVFGKSPAIFIDEKKHLLRIIIDQKRWFMNQYCLINRLWKIILTACMVPYNWLYCITKKNFFDLVPRKIPVTKISTGISSVDIQFILTKTSIHKISEVSKSQVKPP